MGKQKIAPGKFDLEGFVAATLGFLREDMSNDVDPSWGVMILPEPGGTPVWGPEEGGRDLVSELTNEGKALFFPFSSSNVGDPIPAADGKTYELPCDIDEVGDGDFWMGETANVGHLVNVQSDGTVVIQSAVFDIGHMPPPTLEAKDDCGLFTAPMQAFIDRFVKS